MLMAESLAHANELQGCTKLGLARWMSIRIAREDASMRHVETLRAEAVPPRSRDAS